MRKHFPGQVYVASAGIRPGDPDGFVTAVMDEIGIDMSGAPAQVGRAVQITLENRVV